MYRSILIQQNLDFGNQNDQLRERVHMLESRLSDISDQLHNLADDAEEAHQGERDAAATCGILADDLREIADGATS